MCFCAYVLEHKFTAVTWIFFLSFAGKPGSVFFRDLFRLLTFKKIGLKVGAFSLICQVFAAVV